MPNAKDTFDLTPLEPDYEIVGELSDAAGARTYIAKRKGDVSKRREDNAGVLITVATTPEGDEAHALTRLAADTQLLGRTPHRRLVPVIEGRWLGDDAFAVVTQRITDPSLAQRLASGETFTNPRIAAILREVNGLLDWARDQKIVHRAIPASRVFLEPKTDRVRVTFAISPIRRLHPSDARDDARTIARLAMAMLTGEADPRAYAGQTLAELRPDLPERLEEVAGTLLDEKNNDPEPDVAGFLALVGMADPVAAGEQERERIRAEILEEQRSEREKLANERAAFELTMAQEREKLAADRATMERKAEAERERLEEERLALQASATREREELQRTLAGERAALAATRTEMERVVAKQKTELERSAERDRQQLAEIRESIRRAGELEIERKRTTALEDIHDSEESVLDSPALDTPAFVLPMLAPMEPLDFSDDSPLMRRDPIVFERPVYDSVEDVEETDDAEAVAAVGADETRDFRTGDGTGRRKWILAGSGVAVLAIIGIGAVVLGGREPERRAAPRPVAATPVATPVAAPRMDSAAAVIAPSGVPVATSDSTAAASGTTAPAALTDSARLRIATRWLDSLKEAHPVEMPQPRRVVSEAPPAPRPTPTERPASTEIPNNPGRQNAADRPPTTPQPRPAMIDNPFFIPGSTPVRRPDTPVRRPAGSAPRRDSTTATPP